MARSRAVAEFQGLYGPYTLHERVLQKIWMRADFDTGRAVAAGGRSLEILATGRWNHLGGPDFRGARLRLDGEEITGDIEVHFRATDWFAHGHDADPAYASVVLHVVLFPSESGARPARRADGVVLPELALLPLLHRDLEEYAADDALETITARDDWRRYAELAAMPPEKLAALLRELARERWEQKTRHARLRIQRLGWSDACHHTALEILGYRHNRSSMLGVATRCPLAAWREGLPPDEAYRCVPALWQLQGVRPANHPLTRLRQYAEWTRSFPDWPERLSGLVLRWPMDPAPNGPVAEVRQTLGLARLRTAFESAVTGRGVGGTRLDTLVCDGLLPLAAAETGRELFAAWFHWYLGDLPETVKKALFRLGIAGVRDHPFCHGCGQGLLGWLLRQGGAASG